jgi:carbonic anhydrase/acetyltransferase-like protein (isoleucine patch superfamily)
MIYALDGELPEIDPSAFVAPDASVIGRVRIGAGASVWFGARARGDNEWITIGQGTNIQDNSVLHSDWGSALTIGAGCTIGHMAMIHGCTVGDDCLIGMKATILNGATIGAGTLIGAGALVTEGKVIPEGVLALGSPAKIVRDLTHEERARLKQSALHYQENARRFRAGLTSDHA